MFARGLMESRMNSAVLAGLHKVPVSPHASLSRSLWMVALASNLLTSNLDKRALHCFLQVTRNDVKQDRSQDRPAGLHSLPAPRTGTQSWDPVTMTF